jgi:hypothetical protein
MIDFDDIKMHGTTIKYPMKSSEKLKINFYSDKVKQPAKFIA